MSLGSLGDLASLGNFADLGNMGDLPKLGGLGNAGTFSSFFSNMFGSFGHLDKVSGGEGTQAGTGATVDPEALISNLVSMATAAVNAAVSSGLLTQTQANTIISSLTPTMTELVHKILDAGLNLDSQAADWASFGSFWMAHHH